MFCVPVKRSILFYGIQVIIGNLKIASIRVIQGTGSNLLLAVLEYREAIIHILEIEI